VRQRVLGMMSTALLTVFLIPMAVDASQREPSFFARSASIEALDAAAPTQADRAGGSGLIMLVGFLSLIAALLTHWSRDASCREDRCVHRTDEAA
jgi:hypothetical protein